MSLQSPPGSTARLRAALHHPARPPADELRAALQLALDAHFGRQRAIVRMRRRRSPYRSSFAIEDLALTLDDGEALSIIFKDASWNSLAVEARDAKPSFLHDPRREIEVYHRLLAPHDLGPRFYGSAVDEASGRYWLFIEKVSGVELYQSGDLTTWQAAARWLAALHGAFAAESLADAPLLRHDRAYYGRWLDRARDFRREDERATAFLERLGVRYDDVIDRLLALPCTLLHGEFYASNVLVREEPAGTRVFPVDWEMAAEGTGLSDLAALVAGWPDAERAAIAGAYFESLANSGTSRAAFDASLDYARLQLALQWLGWAEGWTPPPEHARDWLQEAIEISEILSLT